MGQSTSSATGRSESFSSSSNLSSIRDGFASEEKEKKKAESSKKLVRNLHPKALILGKTALRTFLDDNQLEEFSACFEFARIPANSYLFVQGQRIDHVFVVCFGKLSVFVDMRRQNDEDAVLRALTLTEEDLSGMAERKKSRAGTISKTAKKSYASAVFYDPVEDLNEDSKFVASKSVGDVVGQESMLEIICGSQKSAFCSIKAVGAVELLAISREKFLEHIRMKDNKYRDNLFSGLGLNAMEFLQNLPLYKNSGIDFEKNQILWTMFRWRNLSQGETLFEEESIGKSMFVVYEGVLSVEMRGDENKKSKNVVAEIFRGEILGEIGMLIDAPRSGTVKAKVPSVLLEIGVEEFNYLLAHYPIIARRITEIARKKVVRNFRKYRIPFFESLTDSLYNTLGELCSIQQIPPGEVIFDLGDYGDRFYMIAYGYVGIYVPKEEKRQMEKMKYGNSQEAIKSKVEIDDQIEVCRIGPGRYFGELALVTDSRRSASARAHTRCVILSITKAKFEVFFNNHPEAASDFQIKLAKYNITLKQILAHPRGLHFFSEHCKKEFSEENVDFYKAVREYERLALDTPEEELKVQAESIIKEFVAEDAKRQVNLPWNIRDSFKSVSNWTIQSFEIAKNSLIDLMDRDSYARFKSSPLFQEFLKEMEAYDFVQSKK